MYEELIQKLRESVTGNHYPKPALLLQAADAIEDLSAQLAAKDEENNPLTLDELQGMELLPVYIVFVSGGGCWRVPYIFNSDACSTDWPATSVRFTDKSAEMIADYGITWLAYLRPPEREE